MKSKTLKVVVDFDLVSVANGRVFRGSSSKGDYEGVLRVETTKVVNAYTNRRYFAGIVRRFIDENTAEWKAKGQEVVDLELGDNVYEVGNEFRRGFAQYEEVSGITERSYSLRQTKYIVYIDTGWKTTATTDYGITAGRRVKEEI